MFVATAACPGCGARDHEALIEGAARALARLEAHRAGDVGDRREPLRLEDRQRPERRHVLRAVDEREPLLRLEHHRRNPRHPQRVAARQVHRPVRRAELGAGAHARLHRRLPFADHREREVRERREIPDAPTLPCAGMRGCTPLLSMSTSSSTSAGRTPECPSASTCARRSIIPRTAAMGRSGPMPVRVRAHQVLLQLAHVGGADARLAERAEAGVHAVDARRVVAAGADRVDGRAGLDDLRARVRIEQHGPPAQGDVFEILEAEGGADANGFHVRGLPRSGTKRREPGADDHLDIAGWVSRRNREAHASGSATTGSRSGERRKLLEATRHDPTRRGAIDDRRRDVIFSEARGTRHEALKLQTKNSRLRFQTRSFVDGFSSPRELLSV